MYSFNSSVLVRHISMLKKPSCRIYHFDWSLYVYSTEKTLFFKKKYNYLSLIVQLHPRCSLFGVFNLNVGMTSMQYSFSSIESLTEVLCLTCNTAKHTDEALCRMFLFSWKYCTFFVMLEYFVNHRDLEWFYSPLSTCGCYYFFLFVCFFTVLIREGNYSDSRMCCQVLPGLCVQVAFFYSSCCCCICMAVKSDVLVGKCYKSSQKNLRITPHSRTPVLFVFHCHSNIFNSPLVPVCMFFFKKILSL